MNSFFLLQKKYEFYFIYFLTNYNNLIDLILENLRCSTISQEKDIRWEEKERVIILPMFNSTKGEKNKVENN